VPFFTRLLTLLQTELRVEVVVVDAHVGLGELVRPCALSLGDEVVLLTSLASDSLTATRHLVLTLKAFRPGVGLKVVVSRVPKSSDLPGFHQSCALRLGLDEADCHLLYSYRLLETDEFLAMRQPKVDPDMADAYLRIFAELDVRASDRKVLEQLEKIRANMLVAPAEETEKKLEELAALHAHPDVYMALVHFYQRTGRLERLRGAVWKLYDLLPDDPESERLVLSCYLNGAITFVDRDRLLPFYRKLHARGTLDPRSQLNLADILDDEREWGECVHVVTPLIAHDNEAIRNAARRYAASALSEQGQVKEALRLAATLPIREVPQNVMPFLADYLGKTGDVDKLWALVKERVRSNPRQLEEAARMALTLEDSDARRGELRDLVRTTRWWREAQQGKRDVQEFLEKSGFPELVQEIDQW
jgi:hypothetical protein